MKLLSFLLTFGLVSCQDLNSNSSDQSKYGSGVPTGSNTFTTAYYIVKDRCANCHDSSVHDKWATYLTQADWEANESTITFGNADASSFITRLNNYSSAGDMPRGGALDDAEYEALLEWVNTPP